MRLVSIACASSCALALILTGCYWLTKYDDLSNEYGEDAAAGVDASSDGGFCPPNAGSRAYCMDFDGVDAQALGLQVSGANAAIVDGPYFSPPSSLSVQPQGASSYGRYQVAFSNQPTSVTLEFQLQVVDLDEGVTTCAISFVDAATDTTRTLNVVVLPNAQFQVQEYFAFGDGGSQVAAHPTTQAGGTPSSGWRHIVLALTANEMTNQYLSGLTVDDQVLEEAQALTLPWARGSVMLAIGVTFAAAAGPPFFFDNVRADFTM